VWINRDLYPPNVLSVKKAMTLRMFSHHATILILLIPALLPKVKAEVKNPGGLLDVLGGNRGVKQGDSLSDDGDINTGPISSSRLPGGRDITSGGPGGKDITSGGDKIDSILSCDYCVENAECVVGKCVCAPGFEGNPYFYCYNPTTTHVCFTKSDPQMRTLGGENMVHHIIGSTRIVQLTTERDGGGFCKFWLWGFTKRHRGKQYYGGFSFRLDQVSTEGKSDVRKGHVTAIGNPGEPYTWTVNMFGPGEPFPVTEVFSSDAEPFAGHAIGGCDIENEQIAQDFMKFSVGCCGLQFAIRGFHEDYPEVEAGLWFEVEKDNYPSYETWDDNAENTEPMCLDHYRQTSVRDIIDNSQIEDRREALTFHAMTNTPLTTYPLAPYGLGMLKILLRDCPASARDDLLKVIRFFFDNPKLTKCLNGAGDDVGKSIEGIEYAASLICNDAVDGCDFLANLLATPECKRVRSEFPELQDLSNPNECNGGVHNDFLENNGMPGFGWGWGWRKK